MDQERQVTAQVLEEPGEGDEDQAEGDQDPLRQAVEVAQQVEPQQPVPRRHAYPRCRWYGASPNGARRMLAR
jgi:hypothetical protein